MSKTKRMAPLRATRKDWSDETRGVKRSLSTYEKGTWDFTRTKDKVLLLPGSIGAEIEDCLAAGCRQNQLRGVEWNEQIANELYEHYFDEIQIHWMPLLEYIEKAQADSYQYCHLDFCGHLGEAELDCIIKWNRIAAPQSRLRVSLVRSRKSAKQVGTEATYKAALLEGLARHLEFPGQDFQDRFQAAAEVISDSKDSLQIVALTHGVSVMTGLDPWELAFNYDDMNADVQKTGWVTEIERWTYSEHHGAMETIWMDCGTTHGRRSATNKAAHIVFLMEQIMNVVPSFTEYR